MTGVANFQKHKIKRDLIDPTFRDINELSMLFKKFNFKDELALLTEFYDLFTEYTIELEKANWVEKDTPIEMWNRLNFMKQQLNFAAKKRLMELGF